MVNIMPGVEYIPTEAKGGYGIIKPIAVVNHIMQGYQRTMIGWAGERPPVRKASAHFSINRDGRIVQHVPINEGAWHSGNVQKPTWNLLKRIGLKPMNPNGYTVGIEYEGFSVDPVSYGYDYLYDVPGSKWPEAMVLAGIKVHKFIMDQCGLEPSTDTVIGHYVIDGVNRVYDPGNSWPQQRIIDELIGVVVPPPINKNKGYYAIARGRAKPIRVEGSFGVYELKVEI